jgi:hypothetical protein
LCRPCGAWRYLLPFTHPDPVGVGYVLSSLTGLLRRRLHLGLRIKPWAVWGCEISNHDLPPLENREQWGTLKFKIAQRLAHPAGSRKESQPRLLRHGSQSWTTLSRFELAQDHDSEGGKTRPSHHSKSREQRGTRRSIDHRTQNMGYFSPMSRNGCGIDLAGSCLALFRYAVIRVFSFGPQLGSWIS